MSMHHITALTDAELDAVAGGWGYRPVFVVSNPGNGGAGGAGGAGGRGGNGGFALSLLTGGVNTAVGGNATGGATTTSANGGAGGAGGTGGAGGSG